MQSLGHWSGNAHVTVAGRWLEAGKYMLQLALDPARCRCDIGQHGSLPWEVSWKLQLLPTADAKACPIVPDDSKQKYSQVCETVMRTLANTPDYGLPTMDCWLCDA